jgi:hypothetical protein
MGRDKSCLHKAGRGACPTGRLTVPRASTLLRLLTFAVPAALAMAGIQPLLGAAAGAVGTGWAIGLAAPAVGAAALIFVVARLLDRGDHVQPPWYTAWLLLPGSFLLAGAAAMCIFGALVEFPAITSTMWTLLVIGALSWATAMALVRRASH